MPSPCFLRCPAFLFVIACLGVPFSGWAAEPGSTRLNIRWEAVGPRAVLNGTGHRNNPAEAHLKSAGKVNAVVVHPTDASLMYLAGGIDSNGVIASPLSNSGIFKSTDGGLSWVPLSSGLKDNYIGDLWLNRDDPKVMLAASAMSGIYRSADAGATWSQVYDVGAFSFAESEGVLYAATGAAWAKQPLSASAAARVGVAISRDAGKTWQKAASSSSGSVRKVVAAKGVVIAGLGNGEIWKKTPTSSSFVTIAAAPETPNSDLFRTVAINPSNPDEIIVSRLLTETDSDTVRTFISRDGGQTWGLWGPAADGCHTLAYDPANPSRIFIGRNTNPLLLYDAARASRQALNVTVDTRSLHTFPDRPGWVALGSDHGAYLSTDGGATWRDLDGDRSSMLLDGMAVRAGYLLATIQDFNPMVSDNGGATWRELTVSRENGKAFIHPSNPKYQYIMNRAGNGTYVSRDGGVSWSRPSSSPLAAVDWDFPYTPTIQGGASDRFLAIDPGAPERVYVATRDGIYFSKDLGATFTRQSWPFGSCSCVLVDPSGGILVGTRDGSGPNSLWVSRDQGATWVKSSFPDSDVTAVSLSVNPSNLREIVVAGRGRGPDSVFRSSDGGLSFQRNGDGLVPFPASALTFFSPLTNSVMWTSVEFAPPELPGLVALASVNGIYAKVPGWDWTPINGDSSVQYFTQVTWDSGYLYASTYGRGILRTSAPALLDSFRNLPRIDTPPASREAAVGGSATLSVAASGGAPLSYQWQKDGLPIAGATGSSLALARLQLGDAGSYSVVVRNSAGEVTSAAAALTVTFSRLTNLSVLSPLAAPGDTFTLGFVVGGAGTSGSKNVVLRAVGPSLTPLGVTGVLADPKLERFAGPTKTGENDNWGGGTLSSAMSAVGAFALTGPTSRDAAAAVTLAAGDQSMRVSGVGAATGVVLAEVYDATPAASFTPTTPRLLNLSVLKDAAQGITAGFVVAGRGETRVLVRAVGPTLSTAFGLEAAAADPRLTLFAGTREIGANDNWGGGAELTAAFAAAGAFNLPTGSRDAALLATLGPGNYSARVETPPGASGTVLVEVYELP